MYFTRVNDTFRGWFQLVRSVGTLRVDSLSSSFTAIIVNAADSASTTAVVTQSQQKQGLYHFDITSSFLETHGVGEYGVSVEVNESSNPKIVTAFSKVLKVSLEDFDTIVSGVWNAQTSSFNASGSFGETVTNTFTTISESNLNAIDFDSISTKICEIYQILGLELGSPMTVTTAQRVVAAITQSIAGDASTSVTVTRS